MAGQGGEPPSGASWPAAAAAAAETFAPVSDGVFFPFFRSHLFSSQPGRGAVQSLQDLVLRATSGVLQYQENCFGVGEAAAGSGEGGLESAALRGSGEEDSGEDAADATSASAGSAALVPDAATPARDTELANTGEDSADHATEYWPKGKRLPEGAPDSCQTRLMGAVERAIRNAPLRKTKYVFEPVVGTKFNCVSEAQQFYNIYSWEVGFGTKKGDKYGQSMQEFHCQCRGSDNRVQYKTTKKKCPAMIRLHRTTDFGWYVSEHRSEHTHPLSESCAEKLCWNSHGTIDQYTKDMVKYLRDNNVTLAKVNHIMGALIGPSGEAPWSSNSISNLCKRIAKEQREDDVRKTLELFRELKSKDEGFQFCVDFDGEHRIKTLMWCTGRSRSQYAVFGDVVTFDTTYGTNIYKMPFGLFVGVNNHFQSTIFAGVLLTHETAESFKWVFQHFLELMGGDQPQTVLTDQCQAMGIAIEGCWKGTVHLWCRWHVLRTAQEELGPIFNYGSPFHIDFSRIINEMLTIDEFESAWGELLDKYDLWENEFLERAYSKRERWAKPYNKDVFCAGMTSTQRSESANYMLKQHVPRNSSMNRFVMNFHNLLQSRFKAEAEAEHRTKQVVFAHTRAWPIEIHAVQVYTNAAYNIFKGQVDKSTRYHVASAGDQGLFLVVHHKAARRERWARVQFNVQVHDGGDFFECDCGLYSHMGILCCHIIRVMLHIGVTRIPDRHVMNRWTRVARDMLPPAMNFYREDPLPVQGLTYRHRLLSSDAARLVDEGDYDSETFEIATKHMSRAFMEIAEYKKLKDNVATDDGGGITDHDDTDTDMETIGNSYGAAGPSAILSDSEIIRMRPPKEKQASHRPRVTRFKSRLDIIEKKLKKNKAAKDKKKPKSKINCTECGLDGHRSLECHTKSVDVNMPTM